MKTPHRSLTTVGLFASLALAACGGAGAATTGPGGPAATSAGPGATTGSSPTQQPGNGGGATQAPGNGFPSSPVASPCTVTPSASAMSRRASSPAAIAALPLQIAKPFAQTSTGSAPGASPSIR